MGKIKQLPPHEAQKIAAGEVVERPANVVKELIENSIDAGAHRIHLYVVDGGHTLIRVVDDGHGMAPDDAQRCFDHHATSKITSVDDLTTLTSLGFRGEALASIGAVSNVTLVTKEMGATVGITIERFAQQGITTVAESSCQVGTDITVRNLFFNVPARKKFLKPAQTELRQIVQLFHAFCFSHPQIHFTLTSQDKQLHLCPPTDTVLARTKQLFSRTEAQQMMPLSAAPEKDVVISGVISSHQLHNYDRSTIFLFVNNRWIKNQSLVKAVLKGYLRVLPPERYPTAVVAIHVPPASVDINTHPRKQEVQFLHPRMVEQLVQHSIKNTLERQINQITTIALSNAPTIPATHHFYRTPLHAMQQQPHTPYPFVHSNTVQVAKPITNNIVGTNAQTTVITAHDVNHHAPIGETTDSIRIIGQLFKTYIVAEADGFVIIDQHAAHERILYERFKKKFGNVDTVSLLFPESITLEKEELDLIEPHLEIIRLHGLIIERLGERQLLVQSTPVYLKHILHKELVQELIAHIKEQQTLDQEAIHAKLHEFTHAQMACKAAVKAGDELTTQQMLELINNLHTTDNRFACPHGRPTMWHITQYELEKKFKRVA